MIIKIYMIIKVLRIYTASPETMRKLCLSTKFPHQEIRWNYYGVLRSVKSEFFCKFEMFFCQQLFGICYTILLYYTVLEHKEIDIWYMIFPNKSIEKIYYQVGRIWLNSMIIQLTKS